MALKDKALTLKSRWSSPGEGRYLSIKEMASYGISGLGVSFIVNVIGVVITATQIPYIYELDVIHGTIIVCVAGALNLLIQPFFGKMLQNTKSKLGRYKPYIVGIAPVISLFVVLATWLPQSDSMQFRMIFAYCTTIPSLVLWNIWFNTFYMIPAVMTPVLQERTDMLAPVGLITGLAPTVMNVIIGPIRSHFIDKGQEYMAFRLMGLVSVGLGLLMVFLILRTKERIYATPEDKESIGVIEGLRLVMKNKPLMIYTAAMIAGSMRTVSELSALYIGQFRYGETTQAGLNLFSALSLPVGFATTIAMVALPFMTRKLNNKVIMILWQAVASAGYLVIALIGFQNIKVGLTTAIIFTIVRFLYFMNAQDTLKPIMLSEMYDYQQWKTGRRLEGFIQTFAISLTNLALQFSMLIPAFIQRSIGFQPMLYKNGAEYLPENIAVMNTWFNVAAWISAISGVAFIVVMALYPLSRKKYDSMMVELKEKAQGTLDID